MTSWWHSDIPKEEQGDSWVLIEERLDERIKARISSVLQEWEVSQKNFEKADQDMNETIKTNYSKVLTGMDELEKSLRGMTGDKEVTTATQSCMADVVPINKQREFDVDVTSETDEYQHALHSILTNLIINPASLFSMGKSSIRQEVQQRHAQTFQANKVKYMEERSLLLLMQLINSDKAISELVNHELESTAESIEFVFKSACDRINSNCSLLQQLQKKDKHERPELQKTCQPLNEILEETMSFMYRNIQDYDFPENVWIRDEGQKEVKQESVVSTLLQLNLKEGPENKKTVSVKQMVAGSLFKQWHLYLMARNLR